LLAHVLESPFIPKGIVWPLDFPLAEEDKQLKPALSVVANQRVCTPLRLSVKVVVAD